MKSFAFIAVVLKATEVVSANDLAAMEAPADTWCITYLSTYIAAVTNQGDLSPTDRPDNEVPSAQNSGRLPSAPSLRPTFARNTSVSITRSALSTDIGPDSSTFTSEVINTAHTSLLNSESSALDVDPTVLQSSSVTLTMTDGLSTVVTPTTDAEATSTSTDIIEPAGRNVILLIQTADNEKRSFYKRANNEFVGENTPEVCTFADTFNLAEGQAGNQLFAEGLPIYYSGEDYKELSAQSRPPRGSITSGFTDSGGTLAFRNSELPNGEAGFCQDADGQVYITFTTGPSGCTPVSLGIYNVEQCQDGRLVGLDDSTSSGVGIVTETAEKSISTQPTSTELPESTGLVPSESSLSASQTSVFEASVTRSSYVTGSSTQGPGDASDQETSSSTSELATEASDLLDSTTTSGVQSQATTGIATSDTEITIMTSLLETTIIPETTETTGVDTSSTEVVNDVDTTTTDTIDTTTTYVDPTTLPENPTSTEAETTTAEITTTAEPTTTTAAAPEPEPQFSCGDPGYTTTYTYSGVTFNLLCDRDYSFSPLRYFVAQSYGECMRSCALNSACDGIVWEPTGRGCSLSSGLDVFGPFDGYDVAQVVSRPA